MKQKIKTIAFYLPQFHTIPENNKWWGSGFTEWINVKKAKPLFEGHYQPHEPTEELGYYDLQNIEVQKKQSQMAKDYGIYGFCYYHYWFDGKKLFETPLNNLLKHTEINFPFCVCWANDNWTRKWDGLENEILIKQNHSKKDDLDFINDLIPVLKDSRYITIDGKPLLILYRANLLPDAKKTTDIWREQVKKYGISDLYIVTVENFDKYINPNIFGCDAGIIFAPNWDNSGEIIRSEKPKTFSYDLLIEKSLTEKRDYPFFRCVAPSWDNAARRQDGGGSTFVNASPEKYKFWLKFAIKATMQEKNNLDENIVFINAWNEWGEGAHLEPDKKFGFKWLEATKFAIENGDLEFNEKVMFDYDLIINDSIINNKIKILENNIKDKDQKVQEKEYIIKNKIQEIENEDKIVKSKIKKIEEQDHIIHLKDHLIDQKVQEIQLKNQKIDSKIYELSLIYSSRAWKVIILIRKILNVFIPVGSFQRKIAGYIYRFCKKIIKSIYKIKELTSRILRLIKKALFVLRRDGLLLFSEKVVNKISKKIRALIFVVNKKETIRKKTSNSSLKTVYYLSNVAEGGSRKYILDLIDKFETSYLNFVQLKNRNDLEFYKKQFKKNDIFLFQHLFFSDLTLDDILDIKIKYNIKLVIPIHDFYFLNKDLNDFTHSSTKIHSNYLESKSFLPKAFELLVKADLIIFPSHFVKNIFDSIFVFKNSRLSRHIDYKINDFLDIPAVQKTINIAIINNITIYKGADYYLKLFSINKFKNYNIQYHIFGTEKIELPNVTFHGPYNEGEIFSLLEKNNIHGLVFLNKWGETYSYSLTKGINSGLPILYSNIGAYIERLQNNEKYFPICDNNNIKADLEKMLDLIIKKQGSSSGEIIVNQEKNVPSLYRDLFSVGNLNHVNKKISVIVPNYNYENFLEERLYSIINQTYKPFEIIFLDDNSQDNSVVLAEKILSSSKIPYKIIQNKINKGCFAQWIKGITEAKGDLIWIAEADDYCELNFLENLVLKFIDERIVLAYCQSRRIDENGRETEKNYLSYTDDISLEKWQSDYEEDGTSEILNAMCIKNTIPNASAVVFRKMELDFKKLVTFKTAGDWFFYLMLLQKGDIAYSSKVLNSHRRHSKSIIGSFGVMNRYRELVSIQNYVMNKLDISDENRCKIFKHRELVYKNDISHSQKEDKNINICFSCDDNYVRHLSATLASILDNSSKDDIYNIYILDGGISNDNKINILKMNNIRDFNLKYITIEKEDFTNCPITDYASYLTIATYYRFKIPTYLKNLDKVLYMDCDMIANRDIRELFDTNIDDYYVAAVPEVCNHHHKRRLEIEGGHYYFNAGLLLINNKKWKEEGIEEKLFEYALHPKRTIVHSDQDVLNDVLKYNVTYLPLSWNFQHDAIDMDESYLYHQKERMIALNNPYIIHYTNKYKPWHKECTNKFKGRYFEYLKITPFNEV